MRHGMRSWVRFWRTSPGLLLPRWHHRCMPLASRSFSTPGVASFDGTNLTPAMQQYFDAKEAHPDYLVLMRVGDFYEAFHDDAKLASRVLGITLTARSHRKTVKRAKRKARRDTHDTDAASGGTSDAAATPPGDTDRVPMAGIPHHVLESYLARLVRAGVLVAVCDQTESPAEARAAGRRVVRRKVTRLVTPGTLLDESLLRPKQHNHLAALVGRSAAASMALCWADVSTGESHIALVTPDTLAASLARVAPAELLLPPDLMHQPDIQRAIPKDTHVTAVPASDLAHDADHCIPLDTAAFSTLEQQAACMIGVYVAHTQRSEDGRSVSMAPAIKWSPSNVMGLDSATIRSLELTRSLRGDRRGSLLATLDATVTSAGARMLAQRVVSPLTSVDHIQYRQKQVQFFMNHVALSEAIRGSLKQTYDIQRNLQRLTAGKGSPKDLSTIAYTLQQLERVAHELEPFVDALDHGYDLVLRGWIDRITGHSDVIQRITEALDDDAPANVRQGFIRDGFSPALDELRALGSNAKQALFALQRGYMESTGIRSLRVKQNAIVGYFVEIPTQHLASSGKKEDLDAEEGEQGTVVYRVPADFVHCQTLKSTMRFKTTQLTELEAKVQTAGNDAFEAEKQMFDELCTFVLDQATRLRDAADAMAAMDVAAALARIAVERDYTLPTVVTSDAELPLCVTAGRHPIVEAMQGADHAFVGNGVRLHATASESDPAAPNAQQRQHMLIVTGPNMGGKSTYLRQTAIQCIMAQMGAPIPAQSAVIGVVDQVFSRVGASDDLGRDQSTFMVEMLEAAHILSHATRRSLVIMDELGRGTASLDGMVIARAVVEHLCGQIQCRALFATHYHELTTLSQILPGLGCARTQVVDVDGDIVFAHRIEPGAADHSYGVHVAELAGMPHEVIKRAWTLLRQHDAASAAPDHRKSFHETRNVPQAGEPGQRGTVTDAVFHDAIVTE